MAKQRNSLGVLVLPVPVDEITWDEYKNTYGIDLDEIFVFDDIFSVKVSKLICIDLGPCRKASNTQFACPNIIAPSIVFNDADGNMCMYACQLDPNSGVIGLADGLIIKADRTVAYAGF